MRPNKKIAITGGIGSGKSTVAEIIKQRGYTVFSCDEIYSDLLKNREFVQRLEECFGGISNADGSLNRKKLSAGVFSDRQALKKLDGITHPAIMEEAFKRMEVHSLAFLEVPLLFENGFESLFDGVIVVLRGLEDRINSVTARNGISREEVEKRIKGQYNYEKSDFSKYYVIHNSGNLGLLKSKTDEILSRIGRE